MYVRSQSLEELPLLHTSWDRGSSGIEIRAVALLPVHPEQSKSCVRVEHHRVLCRHRGCAAVVLAAVPFYGIINSARPSRSMALDVHEEVARASSRADHKDGGEMFSQLLLLGALERREGKTSSPVPSYVRRYR